MDGIIDEDHKEASRKVREIIANYEKERDLILIGAYEEGSDPKVDYAIERIEDVNNYLKQGIEEQVPFDETVEGLKSLFG
jgi:flagellar biosynthesis/type III secretory pathway ATPase